MAKESEIIDFLRVRLSSDAMDEFFDRFAGYRIPKRSSHVVHRQRVGILFHVLVRIYASKQPNLTDAIARAVALETGGDPDHVRRVWKAWCRVGRPRARAGSVTDATKPEAFGW